MNQDVAVSAKSSETESTADAPGYHHCPKCHTLVPNERRDLLGVEECIACTPQKKRPVGAWDYPEGFHERNEGVGGLIILE